MYFFLLFSHFLLLVASTMVGSSKVEKIQFVVVLDWCSLFLCRFWNKQCIQLLQDGSFLLSRKFVTSLLYPLQQADQGKIDLFFKYQYLCTNNLNCHQYQQTSFSCISLHLSWYTVIPPCIVSCVIIYVLSPDLMW